LNKIQSTKDTNNITKPQQPPIRSASASVSTTTTSTNQKTRDVNLEALIDTVISEQMGTTTSTPPSIVHSLFLLAFYLIELPSFVIEDTNSSNKIE
jgi:hypothetical protein